MKRHQRNAAVCESCQENEEYVEAHPPPPRRRRRVQEPARAPSPAPQERDPRTLQVLRVVNLLGISRAFSIFKYLNDLVIFESEELVLPAIAPLMESYREMVEPVKARAVLEITTLLK